METLDWKCPKCDRKICVELSDPRQNGVAMSNDAAQDEARRAHARMVRRHQEFCR